MTEMIIILIDSADNKFILNPPGILTLVLPFICSSHPPDLERKNCPFVHLTLDSAWFLPRFLPGLRIPCLVLALDVVWDK